MFSGSLFIRAFIKIDLYLAVVILLVISAAFTIGGGLTAVIWYIQKLILINNDLSSPGNLDRFYTSNNYVNWCILSNDRWYK